MNELLNALKESVKTAVDGVKDISTLDGLDNMFVVEMVGGERYAVSVITL